MNKSRRLSAASLAALAFLLAACGSEQQPAERPAAAGAAYQDEMDKARGVEATLQQQKEDMDRTLQQNENPTAE